MMERINENLILVNQQMLYHQELESWIRRILPSVQIVKFYCRLWCYEALLPPNRGCSEEDWNRTPFLYRNLRTDQLRKAKEIAIQEADPAVPTVCLIEPFQYEKQLQELKVEHPHASLTVVDFNGISLVDEEWVRQKLPSVAEIQIVCRRWNFSDEYRTKWDTLPVCVNLVSSHELSRFHDTLKEDTDPHPRVIFLEAKPENYTYYREDAEIPNNTEGSHETWQITKMEEVD